MGSMKEDVQDLGMTTGSELRQSITLENEGRKLFGVLHLPKGVDVAPAVLMCHGYAGTKVGKFRMYVRLAEMLAKSGIAALRIDFRGCGDSEGSFHDTTFEGLVSDAMKGLQFLEEHPNVDTSRIGLLGRSMGGVVAVTCARRFGSAKSLALWCPVFSGKPWLKEWAKVASSHDDSANGTVIFQGHLASSSLFSEFMSLQVDRELIPLQNVPLLHIHSEQDQTVHIDQADEYRKVREEATSPSEFIRLHKSNHEFSDHGEQKLALEATAKWFQQTL